MNSSISPNLQQKDPQKKDFTNSWTAPTPESRSKIPAPKPVAFMDLFWGYAESASVSSHLIAGKDPSFVFFIGSHGRSWPNSCDHRRYRCKLGLWDRLSKKNLKAKLSTLSQKTVTWNKHVALPHKLKVDLLRCFFHQVLHFYCGTTCETRLFMGCF